MASMQCHIQRWRKCANNEGDFVKKYSQFHKGCTHNICLFYYNCIRCEKKVGGSTFLLQPCSFHTYHTCIGALAALRDCSIETFSNQNILCIFWFSVVIFFQVPSSILA
jgi:hypothetical protein